MQDSIAKEKSGVKKCLEICAIRGEGGVGRLMANAILNFHFDFPHPSLMYSVECSKPSKRCRLNGLNNQRITFFHCLKPANMKKQMLHRPSNVIQHITHRWYLCLLWLSKESGKCVAMKKVQVLFLSIVVIQKSGIVQAHCTHCRLHCQCWSATTKPQVAKGYTQGHHLRKSNIYLPFIHVFCSFLFLLYSS